MGKQSKRNKQRRGKNRQHRPTGLADDPAAAAAVGSTTAGQAQEDEASPVGNIIKKIRHGDPRVRHAAFVALSSTLFDDGSLTAAAAKNKNRGNNSNSKRNGNGNAGSASLEASNPTLLRALSEKLLDADIPCATAAAGCLANFVSFYCGNGGATDAEEEVVGVASDVMVPILLRRIQTSLGTISSLGNQIMTSKIAVVDNDKKEVTFAAPKPGKKENKSSASANSNDKLYLSFDEQWSLLSLSLLVLVGLIENFPPVVMARMGSNVFPQLLMVLSLAGDSLRLLLQKERVEGKESASDAATNASRALHSLLDDNASLIASLPIGTDAVAASASSFSDNTNGGANPPSLLSAIAELTRTIQNVEFSDMTRLHAAGAILSLRRVLVLEKEISNNDNIAAGAKQLVAALQSCTNEVVVSTLHSLFTLEKDNNKCSPEHLLSQMIELSQKMSAIKEDAAMESQIAREVNERKEPARDIAKRQKKLKEEKKKKLQNEADDSMQIGMEEDGKEESKDNDAKKGESGPAAAAMVVEDDDSEMNKEGDKADKDVNKDSNEDELKRQLDGVVQSWRDTMGSHKLALELITNLVVSVTAGGQEEDEDGGMEGGMYGEDDDDEHMWDSDDEAKLMASAAADNQGSSGEEAMKCTPCEQDTFNSISTHHLPECILVFFRRWTEFLPGSANASEKENVPPPALVSQDVEELLSTCALCLDNVVACRDLPMWDAPAAAATNPSQQQQSTSAKNGLGWFWGELVSVMLSSSSSSGSNTRSRQQSHHVTSVMLSALRNQLQSRTLVDSSTLDIFFHVLNCEATIRNDVDDDRIEAKTQTHRHVISMLGILCSEPHPAEIDAKVCSALLQILRLTLTDDNISNTSTVTAMKHSVVIANEILNVLMDTYGSDDCHDEVFSKLEALDHIKRCLPGFKRRSKKIAAVAAKDGSAGDGATDDTEGDSLLELLDIWNETALNASRFIKYKQNGGM